MRPRSRCTSSWERYPVSDHWILVGQTPVPADLMTWAVWLETNDRRVMFTRVLDTVDVSTIFLGLDHGFSPHAPLLFETMAFWPGSDSHETRRCSTWLQAERQHERVVREVATAAAGWGCLKRAWRKHWNDARQQWGRMWRDQRGIPLTAFDHMARQMQGLDW